MHIIYRMVLKVLLKLYLK